MSAVPLHRRPLARDVSAMELLEWALEADEADPAPLIAGAQVPTAIRREALELLRLQPRVEIERAARRAPGL